MPQNYFKEEDAATRGENITAVPLKCDFVSSTASKKKKNNNNATLLQFQNQN